MARKPKPAEKPATVSTHDVWLVRNTVPATTFYYVTNKGAAHVTKPESKVKASAIYTYLRAVRALGKSQVNSSDVASALDIPEREVRRIMTGMTEKGVRAG